eukprot:scaffold155163_cov24-Tisochrysis_lutea.AAC.1
MSRRYEPLVPKLLQFLVSFGKIFEEIFLRLGIKLHVWTECLVCHECNIGVKHHQVRMIGTGHLRHAGPGRSGFLPLAFQQELEVFVVPIQRSLCPWTDESGTICMAPTYGVSTGERNNFMVIKAHPAKDSAKMGCSKKSIGEAAVRN